MAFWIALAQGGRGPGNEAGLGLGFCFLVEDEQEDTFVTLYIPYRLSPANLWEDIWWRLYIDIREVKHDVYGKRQDEISFPCTAILAT